MEKIERPAPVTPRERTGWIDAVKGLTIILVVAHHAILGMESDNLVGQQTLFWNELLSTVRMPLFFMVAGLFARRAIEGPARAFIDGKLIHFAYFYILWSLILFSIRIGANSVASHKTEAIEILTILWNPISTIWFLYALALAFALTRLVRMLPPIIIVGAALLIQTLALALPPVPHLVIINKFDHLLLYFVLGVYFSQRIRGMAARATPLIGAGVLIAFVAVALPLHFNGLLHAPFLYTIASLLGCAAVILILAATDRLPTNTFLRFIGRYSMPIYLVHFVPVAAAREVLIRLGVEQPLVLFVACVVGSVITGIVAYEIAVRTPASFLFRRPKWAGLKDRRPLPETGPKPDVAV